MLTRIYLENFKCFGALSLPLAQLTLLTGFNAAGKSTTLQSLLLLAQSLRAGNRNAELPLNGPLAQLGTPGEVLNDRAANNRLIIAVETENIKLVCNLQAEDRSHGNALRFSRLLAETEAGLVESDPQQGLDELLQKLASRWGQAGHLLAETLREIIFLSAIRIGTAEVFPSPEEPSPIHANVGIQGEFAPWWFDRFLDEEVDPARRHWDEPAPTLRRQFNAWAGELFPGAQANAQRLIKTSLMRLELRIGDTDDWRRPANIGYGLTYGFPILVAGLLAKPDQLLIIDSPEAHLHPLGQSQMGRFLAHVAAAGVQVIIETHSDHILNGARLAVRDGIIAPNQVTAHFFNYPDLQRSGAVAQVVSPSFDRQGNLSEWPEGFFDQSEKDLARLVGWD